MGAMPTKYNDLEAHAGQANANGLITALTFMGTPIGDPINAKILSDKRFKPVLGIDEIQVGDLAFAGSRQGKVTAILNDGETTPADNRVEVTYPSRIPQDYGGTPQDEVVVYQLVTNDEATGTGWEKVEGPNHFTGLGVFFLREA